jgi:predicted nuclease of restriction endonuclease-like (RecB) superfamily
VQVVANWLIGREIVEEEQKGRRRAEYGKQLLLDLSLRLTADYGRGYSVDNLELFRRFFLEYKNLLGSEKSDALRRISNGDEISEAVRRKSRDISTVQLPQKNHVLTKAWQPGILHPNLSWTHYRAFLRVDKPLSRSFYEIESIRNNWSARETERQINSLLFERLAKSKDKAGLMRLARKGQEIQRPEDVFKDPVVMEFLGLPETPRLVESKLETALINNLQTFLLELGKGFAFVARQHRLTLEGDHFYVDLVFYHTILKCYILIDLKVGKLNHQDLGQLQLYVNYFDRERRTTGDNPTLGLILCTDKNDAVVQYTLGEEQKRQIFSSRYKLHLPTEAELKAEIRRELRILGAGGSRVPSPTAKRRCA